MKFNKESDYFDVAKKVKKSPNPPQMHDAFSKVRGHFNVEAMATQGGILTTKNKETKTLGARNNTIDADILAQSQSKTNHFF